MCFLQEGVHFENAVVPHWEREGLGWGEAAALVSPTVGVAGQPALEAARQQALSIKGFGGTEGTPAAGIEAAVLVVRGWADLAARRLEARGRIVVFAVEWEVAIGGVGLHTFCT